MVTINKKQGLIGLGICDSTYNKNAAIKGMAHCFEYRNNGWFWNGKDKGWNGNGYKEGKPVKVCMDF